MKKMNGVAGLFLAFSLFPLFTLGAEDIGIAYVQRTLCRGSH